jgi:hypothetical protein
LLFEFATLPVRVPEGGSPFAFPLTLPQVCNLLQSSAGYPLFGASTNRNISYDHIQINSNQYLLLMQSRR